MALTSPTAINHRRIWLLTLVSTVLTVAVFLCNLVLFRGSSLTTLAAWDCAFAVPLLASIALIRRRAPRGVWPRSFVVAFAVLWLAVGDAYFFSAFAAAGHNASYAVGVMGCAVFLLLPPRIFFRCSRSITRSIAACSWRPDGRHHGAWPRH